MTKKINRYSIEKYFKKLEIETERKTPKDIQKLLKESRYSESLNGPIEYGKMTIEHFIRSMVKSNDYWLNAYLDMKKTHRQYKRNIAQKLGVLNND